MASSLRMQRNGSDGNGVTNSNNQLPADVPQETLGQESIPSRTWDENPLSAARLSQTPSPNVATRPSSPPGVVTADQQNTQEDHSESHERIPPEAVRCPGPPNDTSQQHLLESSSSAQDAARIQPATTPQTQASVEEEQSGSSPSSASPKSNSTSLKPLSHKDKLGIWSIIVFSAGPILILASMGVLSFLWFGSARNSLWRTIMQRNWLTKAVAICAEVLKQATSFQLALLVGMLAALALERFDPLLQQIASFTMMRATSGSGTVLILFWHYVVGFWHARWKWSAIFGLTVVMSLVYGLTQIISILLLSDIDLRTIPGTAKDVNTSFAFAYHYDSNCSGDCTPTVRVTERGGTWFRKAPDYPVFAEYSEPPYRAEGVDDTGLTLRALLPFQTAQDRESLMAYSGPTTVLDTRVTCQIPNFIDDRVQLTSGMADFLLIEGGVRASRSTPRLGNATLSFHVNSSNFYIFNSSALFSCLAPLPNYMDRVPGDPTEWKITICQLGEGQGHGGGTIAGGLISEFKDASTWWGKTANTSTMQDDDLYGTAYLVFNVTTGDQQAWQAVVENEDPKTGGPGPGYAPPAFSERNEWLDLVFNDGRLVLSATLCYSAFDSANLPVRISSRRNRTEPNPTFDLDAGKYEFSQIRALLGQPDTTSLAPEDRGILQLEPQSWIANATESARNLQPFMRSFADLGWGSPGVSFGWGAYGNVSGVLYSASTCPSQYTNTTLQGLGDLCVVPEQMHIWLFQEMLRAGGGSVASALQGMITLLSTMAYYDQLGQFDDAAVVQQAFFVTANVPVSFRGFVVVAVTIALHLGLSGLVLVLFLRGTRFSRIGATWSALAQGTKGSGRRYVEQAGMCGDGDVEDMMKVDDGVGRKRAGLGVVDVDVEVIVAGKNTATGREIECPEKKKKVGKRKMNAKERVALLSEDEERREKPPRSLTV